MSAEICLQELIPKNKKLLFVEVGVLRATNLIALAKNYPKLNFIGVDSYEEYIDELHGYFVSKELSLLNKTIAENKIKQNNLQEKIRLIIKDSAQFVHKFQNNSIDIVFLDKNFSAKQTEIDVIEWYPKVKPQGILCGHDAYTKEILEAVQIGLKQFTKKNLQTINNEVWFIKKETI